MTLMSLARNTARNTMGASSLILTIVAWTLMVPVVGIVTSSCASLRSSAAQREFVIENKWVRSTLRNEFLGFRRMNRMSPLLLDKVVVQSNAIDGIVAFTRENGAELWRLDIENGVEGGAQAQGDKLYFGASNGLFYCVDLASGRVLWTYQVRAETLAPPSIEGGVVYFQSGADVVYALDAASGKQLWIYNRQVTGNFSIRATTRPVVSGENLYVGFSDGFVAALRRRDGNLLWERKLGKGSRFRDVDSTPVIDGNNLYIASYDGTLASLNAETGEVNWQLEEGGYVPVTLGRERLSDRLYYATVSGRILMLDKRTGKLLQTIQLRKGIPTQPTVYRGFLVYGESEGALVVADAETGATVSRFEPGRGLVARPSVVETTGETYFISNNANLFAMKLGYRRSTDRLPWQKTEL